MKHLFRSFSYAFKGLGFATRTQFNFRIHLVVAVLVMAAAYWLQLGTNEWFWVLLSIVLVLSAELFNTALEVLTDMVSPEWNEKAGRVKDMGAAAVTIFALFAMVVATVIFVPRIFILIFIHVA